MAFLSARYLLFFPVVVLLWYLLPRGGKGPFLLGASWIFYLFAGPQYFPLLLTVIVGVYFAGRLLEQREKRWVLPCALTLCVGLLVLFKYLGFLTDLLSGVLGAFGLHIESPALKLMLPAGISFYLFQAMGYLMDVHRGTLPAERDFLSLALFLSYFPSLLSGPIARAPRLLPQLTDPRPFSWDDLRTGALRFLWGAFMKAVVADRLAILVRTVFAAPESYGRLQLFGAAVAFALQIYCDFAAYSHMAIGSARAMGIELGENFNAPYLARSVQDFWRRWHISLSTWFRDYLYIPLGGSRRGTVRKYLNVLIVFTVSGLWHGAALTFLVWGLLNGLYQVLGALTAKGRARVRSALHLPDDGFVTRWWQRACTFTLAMLAFVFFQASSLGNAWAMLSGLFTGPLWVFLSVGLGKKELLAALLGILVVLAVDLFSQKRDPWAAFRASPRPLRWAIVVALLLSTVIFGSYGPGYDVQSFVYFQF